MPREITFQSVYMPTMTLMFFIAAALAWALDRFLAGSVWHRFFWHAALLRLILFTCLFGAMALTVYR